MLYIGPRQNSLILCIHGRCKSVLIVSFCCYSGPKNRQRFLCEVRVDGFSYVGAGNSGNKKDAQANAVKDFVQYLVRQGKIPASQVPMEVCMFFIEI